MYTLDKRERDQVYDAAETLYWHLPDIVGDSENTPAASKSDEDLLRLVRILEAVDSKNLSSGAVMQLQLRMRRTLNDAVHGRIAPSRTAVYTKIALQKFLNRRVTDEAAIKKYKRSLAGAGSLNDLIHSARKLITEALQQEEHLTVGNVNSGTETRRPSLTFHEEADILFAISELSVSLRDILEWAEDSSMFGLVADMVSFLEKSVTHAGSITSWAENFRLLPILEELDQVMESASRGNYCSKHKANLQNASMSLKKLMEHANKRQPATKVTCEANHGLPKEGSKKVKIVDDERVKTREILDNVVNLQRLVHKAYYSVKGTNNGRDDLLIRSLKEDTGFLCISELSYVSTIDKTAIAKVISKIARKTYSVLSSGIFPSAHKELYEAYKLSVSLVQSLPAVSKVDVERHSLEVSKILDRLLLVDRFFVDNTNQCKADVRVLHARILVEGCIVKLANEGLDECFAIAQKMLRQAMSVSKHALGADSTAYLILRQCVCDMYSLCDSLSVLRPSLPEAGGTEADDAVHLITFAGDDADSGIHSHIANTMRCEYASDQHDNNSFSLALRLLESNAQYLLGIPADTVTLLHPSLLSDFQDGYSLTSILGMCPKTWELLKALSNVLCMTTLLMEEYQTSPSSEKRLLLRDAVGRLQKTKRDAGYLNSDVALLIFKTVASTLNSMAQAEISDITPNADVCVPLSGDTEMALDADNPEPDTVDPQIVTSCTESLISSDGDIEPIEQETESTCPSITEGHKEHALAKSSSNGEAASCDSVQSYEILNPTVSTSFESDLRKGRVVAVERNLNQACEFLDFIIRTHHEDDDDSPSLLAPAFLFNVKEALSSLYSASNKIREGCTVNEAVLDDAQRLLTVLRHELRSDSDCEDLDSKSAPYVLNIRYKSVLRIVAHIREEKNSLSSLRNRHIRSHMHEVLGKIELILKESYLIDDSTQLPREKIGELGLFSPSEDCVDEKPDDRKSLGKVQVHAKELLQCAENSIEELREMLCECAGTYAEQALRDTEKAFSSLARARSLVVTSVNRSILNAAVSSIAAAMDKMCGSYYKSVLPAAPLALLDSIKSCKRLLDVLSHAFDNSKCEERDYASSDSAKEHLLHATRALQHLDINSDVIGKHAVAPVAYRSVHECLCALYDILHEDECEPVDIDTLRHNVHFNIAIYACKALENALLEHIKLCSLQKEVGVASCIDLTHSEMQALNLYEASIAVMDAGKKDLFCVTKAVLLQLSNNLRIMTASFISHGINISECVTTAAALEDICRTVKSIKVQEDIACINEEEGITSRSDEEDATSPLNKASTLITRAMCSIDGDYKTRDETIWDSASCIPLLPGELSKGEYDLIHSKNTSLDEKLPPHCDLDFVETEPQEKKRGFRKFCMVVMEHVKAFFRWIFYPISALYRFCVRTNKKRRQENVRNTLEEVTQHVADLPALLKSHGVNDHHVVGAVEELSTSCINNIELARVALKKQSYADILDASCRMIISDIQAESAIDMLNALPETQEVSESLKSLRSGIRNLEKLLPIVANCIAKETGSNASGHNESRSSVVSVVRPDVFLTYEVLSAGWWGSKNSRAGIKGALTRIHRIFGADAKFAVHPALIIALCSQHDLNALDLVCTNLVVIGAHGDYGLQKVLDIFANSILSQSHARKRLRSIASGSRSCERPSFQGAMVPRMLTLLIGNSCKDTEFTNCAKYSLQHCRIDNIIEALCTVHDGGDTELDFLLNSCRDGIVSENTFARCLRFCGERHAVIIERYMNGCSSNHHISSSIKNIPSMGCCEEGICALGGLVTYRNKAIADVQRKRQISQLQRDKYGKTDRKPASNKNHKCHSKSRFVVSPNASSKNCRYILNTNCVLEKTGVALDASGVDCRNVVPIEGEGMVLRKNAQYYGSAPLRSASYEEGCCYETAIRRDVGKGRGVMVVSSVVAVCMSEERSRGILTSRSIPFIEIDNGKMVR
ncbi:hypothetical protein [Candidatus Anaplasma sp. TIGMIC]|uniref:hypothetical protein n=1 Tax=Candidatus Anaplasma sp. TIGMIC TaxID=3020713 RepID=UPI00233131D6|nr:hypothetical protein [Candidatus Anaplasma sp. TIGMIC]MDB1135601.1 hypothetical protein [Candidatus Anaplasma sp. TIGMIC]